MYAARRRQKSVRRKFQFGKLRIGQQFQLFDNALGQFPQGSLIYKSGQMEKKPAS